MLPTIRTPVLALATIATGLIAGFFYAYTVSVSRGLDRLDDAGYVTTMNAINATVRNAGFAPSFFGAALLLLVALALFATSPRDGRLAWVALAAVLYLGGGFALTAAVNLPLNDTLAETDMASSAAVAEARADYEDPWNTANLVRTLCSTAALAALVGACLTRPRSASA
jgi:uncharacterized membrane protein